MQCFRSAWLPTSDAPVPQQSLFPGFSSPARASLLRLLLPLRMAPAAVTTCRCRRGRLPPERGPGPWKEEEEPVRMPRTPPPSPITVPSSCGLQSSLQAPGPWVRRGPADCADRVRAAAPAQGSSLAGGSPKGGGEERGCGHSRPPTPQGRGPARGASSGVGAASAVPKDVSDPLQDGGCLLVQGGQVHELDGRCGSRRCDEELCPPKAVPGEEAAQSLDVGTFAGAVA
mmetsp:Transcript_1840/g.4349  ORF Transcript_1840/g.4349 Transcript_1840/m.4349 type:complete len:229 (+) Transcript_1840:263-949(+)